MNLNKLAALCKERRITFCKLERECGIGNGIIGRWKASAPSITNLKKVADYLGVTVDELLKD